MLCNLLLGKAKQFSKVLAPYFGDLMNVCVGEIRSTHTTATNGRVPKYRSAEPEPEPESWRDTET